MPYKYQCDSCNRDITNVVRIQCAECDIDLCVTCFSSGVELKKHKNNHPYKIIVIFKYICIFFFDMYIYIFFFFFFFFFFSFSFIL